MELFVYADEVSDPIIGSGVLISKSEIKSDVIEEAISNLKSDEEFDGKLDSATVARGRFHASEDSKNAHSWFCRTITKKIKGNFIYSYMDRNKLSKLLEMKTDEDLFRMTLSNAFVRIFSRVEKVNLIVEERNKFGVSASKTWIEGFYDHLEAASYRLPSLLTFYPEISVTVGQKSIPGLQVTDFLLWAVNRAKYGIIDETWLKRLNMHYLSHLKEKDGPQSGGEYYINENHEDTTRLNYPVRVPDPKNHDELFDAYLTMEHTLRQLKKFSFPTHVSHLKEEVDHCANLLINKDIDMDDKILKKCSSIYLRVFDTLPIYASIEDGDISRWEKVLRSKKMVSSFLNSHLSYSIDIIKIRQHVRKNNPELLEIEL